MNEGAVREQMAELGRSLFERGLTVGTAGNISSAVAGMPAGDGDDEDLGYQLRLW